MMQYIMQICNYPPVMQSPECNINVKQSFLEDPSDCAFLLELLLRANILVFMEVVHRYVIGECCHLKCMQ